MGTVSGIPQVARVWRCQPVSVLLQLNRLLWRTPREAHPASWGRPAIVGRSDVFPRC